MCARRKEDQAEMSKRHEALIPLTHDHHHALAQARRVIAASSEDTGARLAQAQEFLDFFFRETLQHFREEEEVVFPLLVNTEAVALLGEILLDHVRIHSLVRTLSTEVENREARSETLRELGEKLQSHIRKEEDQLFPMIEAVAAEGLASLRLGPRNRGNQLGP